MRIGLHTGEPVREADDFYGKSVNLAARIAAEARGSEILVSSLVHDLIAQAFELYNRQGSALEPRPLVVLDEAANTPLPKLPQWAATITGSVVSLVGILLTNRAVWSWVSGSVAHSVGVTLPAQFWLNGMEVAITAAGLAVAVYVTVSLLTPREAFDLDRMLHRGRYAPPGGPVVVPLPLRERFRVKNILQFDANFTFTDKLVSGGIFWWAMFLLVVNVVVSAWNLFIYDWPISWWSKYWLVAGVGVPFAIALATLIWFGIGGVKDIFAFFHALRTMDRDVNDNGTVRSASPGGFPVVDGAMPAPATSSPAAPVAPTPVADDAVKAGAAVAPRPIV